MIAQQGQTFTRVYSDLSLDPRYGPAVREIWRGNRSALAALTMKQMGYENVSSMARGFQGWAEIGGEVVD